MESILTSIKKLLGIAEEYTHFDADIIIHINTVFSILKQMGVGPSEGFMIKDDLAVWSDFIPEGFTELESVKTYIYLKVKLIFDSSTFGTPYLEAIGNMIKELEWRLIAAAESHDSITA